MINIYIYKGYIFATSTLGRGCTFMSFHRRDWRKQIKCDVGELCKMKDTNITWNMDTNVTDLVMSYNTFQM